MDRYGRADSALSSRSSSWRRVNAPGDALKPRRAIAAKGGVGGEAAAAALTSSELDDEGNTRGAPRCRGGIGDIGGVSASETALAVASS